MYFHSLERQRSGLELRRTSARLEYLVNTIEGSRQPLTRQNGDDEFPEEYDKVILTLLGCIFTLSNYSLGIDRGGGDSFVPISLSIFFFGIVNPSLCSLLKRVEITTRMGLQRSLGDRTWCRDETTTEIRRMNEDGCRWIPGNGQSTSTG
ncbi:hypothetical protein BDN67DRAFT_972236 [Paxillus ammoniavirescens]|nr:hypothetical protein BDN67DRAFT_972236 [Paxillus ammoniavirescens]